MVFLKASIKPCLTSISGCGRRAWLESIEDIQAVLDDYIDGYNTKRPHQGRGINGRTPIITFPEELPKTSNTEVTSQTKAAKLNDA
jgi:hypothetical protein